MKSGISKITHLLSGIIMCTMVILLCLIKQVQLATNFQKSSLQVIIHSTLSSTTALIYDLHNNAADYVINVSPEQDLHQTFTQSLNSITSNILCGRIDNKAWGWEEIMWLTCGSAIDGTWISGCYSGERWFLLVTFKDGMEIDLAGICLSLVETITSDHTGCELWISLTIITHLHPDPV